MALLPLLLLVSGSVFRDRLLAEQGIYAEVLFEDSEAHSGPGPHPASESKSFKRVQGGMRWFGGGVVEYLIVVPRGSPALPVGYLSAVEDAVGELDGFITARSFARVRKTTQINPCTGEPNSISWLQGDGSGGVLAAALACFNTKTKEIVGFRVALDSLDDWSTAGDPGSFDVENVAAHEIGHVAGLGHVNGPKDGCLTMYKFSGRGETQKRSLGLGDKRGMDELYDTGDTSFGPGCGS